MVWILAKEIQWTQFWKIRRFNIENGDWTKNKFQFVQYFITNVIFNPEKQCTVFLSRFDAPDYGLWKYEWWQFGHIAQSCEEKKMSYKTTFKSRKPKNKNLKNYSSSNIKHIVIEFAGRDNVV